MDLAYGEEYETFREEVRAFLAERGKQSPPQFSRGKSDAKARAWQQLLIEHGYAARTIPKQYGGYGAEPDVLKAHIIAEEFAKARVRAGHIGDDRLVPTLLELGTEEQKRAYIPPTVRGEMRWCQGYSEPNSGSDLASLSTRAELDGDEFVINGQKIWTSGAQHADMMFCLVRTEPDAPKHQGISYLLFSMDTPGIEVRPLVTMTGEATFNEVFFTGRARASQPDRGAPGRGLVRRKRHPEARAWRPRRSEPGGDALPAHRRHDAQRDHRRATVDGVSSLSRSPVETAGDRCSRCVSTACGS